MFDTSRDVLNLVLSISIFLVATALAYLLFQMSKTFRAMNRVAEGAEKIVKAIEESIERFKDKTSNIATYLTVVLKTGQQILEMVQNKRAARRSKKSAGPE
jgi:uncharacterized protein YoxC